MRDCVLRLGFLTCAVVLILAWFRPEAPKVCAANEPTNCGFVMDALTAARNVKVGMVRADVEREFEFDGGLSAPGRATYVYRRCHFIKINVDFTTKEGATTASPNDEIERLSAPYLALPVSD